MTLSADLLLGKKPLPAEAGAAFCFFSAVWNLAEAADDFEAIVEVLVGDPGGRVDKSYGHAAATLRREGEDCAAARIYAKLAGVSWRAGNPAPDETAR